MTNNQSFKRYSTLMSVLSLAAIAGCVDNEDVKVEAQPLPAVVVSHSSDVLAPPEVSTSSDIQKNEPSLVQDEPISIIDWNDNLHPSIHSTIYNALEIIDHGKNVCSERIVALSDIPGKGYENLRKEIGSLYVPLNTMVCDFYPGAELCYFDTDKPIFFKRGTEVIELKALDLTASPEIHFSDHDIVCRITRRKV